jgi:glycerol-1-phosphate dehydrogenase [NAD(P)+]
MPKEMTETDPYLRLGASGLADTVLHCPFCGKDHAIPIGLIRNEAGIARSITGIASGILGRAPRKTVVLYDLAIEELIRECLIDRLPPMDLVTLGLGAKGFHLDSGTLLGDEVARGLDADAELVIAAGSGVIADLGKWVADKAKKPLIIYGTAASMNAHASVTATMTVDGIKTSAWLAPAAAVLMDPEVCARAPKAMTLAGLGDLAARAICNADWKLSHLVQGKAFCPLPFMLTADIEKAYLAAAPGIGRGEPGPMGVLAEAVLVSALSMTMMGGETSPSSGCEHVFSHYWDLQVELEGAPKNLHGTQVGVGTMLSFALYDFMRGVDYGKIDPRKLLRERIPIQALKAENKAKFGSKAYLFDEVIDKKWIPDDRYVPYVEKLLSNWDPMWKALAPYVGDGAGLRKSLESAGFRFSLAEIGRTRGQAIDALVFGARYRSRYTMLDLAGELGLLPGAAGEILDRAGLE